MQVVVHGVGDVPEIVEIGPGDTSRHLLEKLAPRAPELDIAIAVVAERDAEGDLEADVILIEVLAEGSHVHVRHRDRQCEEIQLRIRFGKDTKNHAFRPSDSIGKALDWATENFAIIPSQCAQYRLKLPTATAYLDNDELLGELVTSQPCELLVDLVRFEQNAGAQPAPADEQAIQTDVGAAAFLKGVANQRWRLVRLAGKHAFFEVAANRQKTKMIGVRVDITGYPGIAPQGIFWDLEQDVRLPDAQWPVLPDGNQSFRTNWASGLGLYIACDRSALAAHPDWAQSHLHTNWRPEVGITRYLAVVADLLSMATVPDRAAA